MPSVVKILEALIDKDDDIRFFNLGADAMLALCDELHIQRNSHPSWRCRERGVWCNNELEDGIIHALSSRCDFMYQVDMNAKPEPATDFEILTAMLDRAGVEWRRIVPCGDIRVEAGYAGFFTDFLFNKDGSLKEIGAYE